MPERSIPTRHPSRQRYSDAPAEEKQGVKIKTKGRIASPREGQQVCSKGVLALA